MAALGPLPSSLRERLRWLSLRPFDQSTPQGRANERHRRVALTAATNALARILSVSASLISLPLTLHYLGPERFGMWMTISSLIAMLAFADFGIANGVLGAVASAHGRDDTAGIRRVISSGMFLLCAIAAAVLVIFALVYPMVDWWRIFNAQGAVARSEAGPALAALVVCFAFAIPLGVVQRIQLGLQQGFVAGIWQCIGNVVGLIGVFMAVHLELPLPWLVLTLAGLPLVLALFNTLSFYIYFRPELRPRWMFVSRPVARQIAGMGALFFVLQLTVSVAFTSDNIVLAQKLGAASVAEYAVPEKLFNLIPLVLGMVMAPLWPAYGEAIARGDNEWVRRTLKKSCLLALVCSTAMVCLFLLFGQTVIGLWVGHDVSVPLSLLLAFGAWKITDSVGNALAMFLNGKHVVGFQVLCAIPLAVSSILLKIWLVPRIGTSGVLWASTIAWLICVGVPMCIWLPKFLGPRHLHATSAGEIA